MAGSTKGNQSFKVNKLEIKMGNAKIDSDTLIFNLCSAFKCPSDKLGFCRVSDKCYAKQAETQYPSTTPYRDRQSAYWYSTDIVGITYDFKILFERHEKALKKVRYLRFNESGDFRDQDDVNRTDILATILMNRFNIQSYAHSARKDLDFFKCKTLLIKSSGHKNGNNGMSVLAYGWSKEKVRRLRGTYLRKNVFVCKMTKCDGCTVCKERNNINIIWTR